MTRSKPSTESATGTRKSRWFRPSADGPDSNRIDNLLDLYWGGPKRQITGLTVRIIAVNALALLLLLVGTLYLGQYQKNLIEAKLETFRAEVELTAIAVSEAAIMEYKKPASLPFEKTETQAQLDPAKARQVMRRLNSKSGQRILIFNRDGMLVADSKKLTGPGGVIHIDRLSEPDNTLYTIQILKSMTRYILSLLPERRVLPVYPETDSDKAYDYPDAEDAITGQLSISAWEGKASGVFLSAAAPLQKDGQVLGAILLTREGHDIEQGIGEVMLNIIAAFGATLLVTILLSIYLSGVIARPLRKLAAAAEGVRKGKKDYSDIPDLSKRNDEIGELSIALRQMTLALWERMDTIERFAADVAHEIKNPLTSLRSAVETAAIVKSKEDQKKLLDIIKHDVDRLDRLISDISHASRLDAELSREALEKVDIRAVMVALLDAYANPLDRKNRPAALNKVTLSDGRSIHVVYDGNEAVHAMGVRGRLEQVFQNLLSNALSFSPAGGEVTIRIATDHRLVIVTVEDQGPGIPPNKLETVFERFYTERPGHEGYGRHSGLGLSICRQIVTALGGRIFAENISSHKGGIKGARFTVVLSAS